MNTRQYIQKVNRLMLLLAATLFTLNIAAVPAKPGVTRKITLTDGSTITARLVGDEFGHYWLGSDGQAYRADEQEIFHRVYRLTADETSKGRRNNNNERRSKRLAPGKVTKASNFIGKKKGVIILANFNDLAFREEHNNELYTRIANEKNYKEGSFKGSVYDYFYAQSEGLFDLEFDVVGPVTVTENRNYYGANNAQGDDKHPASMIIEACQLADESVNFADYDWDGDGEVDQVYVVFAGKGEADGGPSYSIWPHEWVLSGAQYYGDGSGPQELDGVTINTYACGPELNGNNDLDGIGTICHEFSHCLGYPDFYDTDYSGGQGMGYWDLMDGGCYNGDGYLPAGYTSYERWVAGWMEPTELTGKMSVKDMKPLQEKAEAYIIYNDANKNEYFLLENREKVGWDAELPGEGLLIIHVDYNKKAWDNNSPNDFPNHQRMTWIPADNEYQYTVYQGTKYYSERGMRNDPFPYGDINSFGAETTPEAKFYNQTSNGTYFMDFLLSDIERSIKGLISFNFKDVVVGTPTFSPENGSYSGEQTITIKCRTKDAAIYYTTDESIPTAESTLYTEPFTIDTTTVIKAIAILDNEVSKVATATFTIRPGSLVKKFQKVKSLEEMESGKYYIIGSMKSTAAGAMVNDYLTHVKIELDNDLITVNDKVEIFFLEGEGNKYSLRNSEWEYLYATETKKLAYDPEPREWELSEVTDGVTLNYAELGTMLFNYLSPRFNIYTSTPSSTMLHALLFKECDTTAISSIYSAPRTAPQGIFTLSGIRVTGDDLPKGIYIRNGKKFVVK
ncbi:MAG: M6 family metalloprotease domain-containing protein [Prevotella sp.]|nr:M6 family metalloprotease domain-containing protein [Prevotella sp.]